MYFSLINFAVWFVIPIEKMGKVSTKYNHNIPDSDKKRIVVIGGGFGGLNLLKKLKGERFQVVLLDRYNYHTFQPLLYQVATAGLEPDSVAGPLRKMIRNRKGWYFRMLKVSRVDLEKAEVHTAAGPIGYDYLVMGTGSKINFFNNGSIAENSYPLKQVTHSLDLRSTIFHQFERLELMAKHNSTEENLNFVVVGAGPTGVEICGALAELKRHVLPEDYPELEISRMQIFLVEGLDRVLPAMSEKSGKRAQRYLEKAGIKILLNCRTESYDGTTVQLSNGENIASNTMIWAAGVSANLPDGIPGIYLEKGAVRVNLFNQLITDDGQPIENVFALGDMAQMATARYPEGLPGLAPVAIQQGRHIGRNLNRIDAGRPMKPFQYINKGVLATIGRNRAVADLPGNIKLGGFPGWVVWMGVHLLYLVGFRNKTVVFTNWMWNYMTYDRGIRLIIRPSPKNRDRFSRAMVDEMHMDK
ncbi:MAG: NAD(P)/FAD-dependent oxidoreductase [Bacteroidales bacterium]